MLMSFIFLYNMTQCEFIEKIKKIHGDKYDYSLTYIGNKENNYKTTAICKIHGEFSINMYNFLNGQGCGKCAKIKRSKSREITKEECLKRCEITHGKKYSYDLSNYHGSHSRISIYCNKHGWFSQMASKHWNGEGCKLCSKPVYDKESFIKEAKKRFTENEFGYDKVNYIDSHTKVDIYCNNCNDYFSIRPNDHLHMHGCPNCNKSLLEREVEKLLTENSITFIKQYSNDDLGRLKLDFYLPNLNIGIECQGRQHFRPYSFFGGEKTFKKIRERDLRKKQACSKNGINLLYYSHDKEDTFLDEKTIKDINKLKNILHQHNG